MNLKWIIQTRFQATPGSSPRPRQKKSSAALQHDATPHRQEYNKWSAVQETAPSSQHDNQSRENQQQRETRDPTGRQRHMNPHRPHRAAPNTRKQDYHQLREQPSRPPLNHRASRLFRPPARNRPNTTVPHAIPAATPATTHAHPLRTDPASGPPNASRGNAWHHPKRRIAPPNKGPPDSNLVPKSRLT